MLAIYPLPVGLLVAGALIPRIGYGATAGAMLCCGLLLTAAIGFGWRHALWRRDTPASA